MSNSHRYACPCCAHLTLTEKPPGTFAICPVCGWEDDGIQFAAPDVSDGANPHSLNEARANFRTYGASSREALKQVRPATPEEAPRVVPKPLIEEPAEGDTPPARKPRRKYPKR